MSIDQPADRTAPAAEEGPGSRILRAHQELVGPARARQSLRRPGIGHGRRCRGESDLVRDDDHRGGVFAELPHNREHFTDQLGIERLGDFVEQHHLG